MYDQIACEGRCDRQAREHWANSRFFTERAQSLLIANDLRRIQAWVSVNEADVGNIYPGEPVTFTVDAIPGRVFYGRVGQVRLNATITQNVVTYTVEVDIDNCDGKLLPYLTANAEFETGRRNGVLLVPNAALRWNPRTDQITSDLSAKSHNQPFRPDHGSATVWIQDGKLVRPIAVTAGLTDGASTEVEGKGLAEGLRIVIGESTREAESVERNPFAPQVYRGQSSGQGQGQTPPSSAKGGDKGKANR